MAVLGILANNKPDESAFIAEHHLSHPWGMAQQKLADGNNLAFDIGRIFAFNSSVEL